MIQRGVASGEFSDTGLSDFPMMLMSPVIASVIWTHLFSKEVDFDMNAALQAHLETMMVGLKA